ncbi:MAG: type IV toxin-antitoxin system AbiEi family antitoxin domain-containing protein [Gammaproteobacteria bacterium]
MQPIKRLTNALEVLADVEHYLFTLNDLRALLPHSSISAFKTLLSRGVKEGYFIRVCRGLYLYKRMIPASGLILFHAATRLRANDFNYISLETVLSDAGIISQQPINWITVMSSGRSNQINCGQFGTIEFIHTQQKPDEIREALHYDFRCKLWRASVKQALRDMKITKRDTDLIDWEAANEFT